MQRLRSRRAAARDRRACTPRAIGTGTRATARTRAGSRSFAAIAFVTASSEKTPWRRNVFKFMRRLCQPTPASRSRSRPPGRDGPTPGTGSGRPEPPSPHRVAERLESHALLQAATRRRRARARGSRHRAPARGIVAGFGWTMRHHVGERRSLPTAARTSASIRRRLEPRAHDALRSGAERRAADRARPHDLDEVRSMLPSSTTRSNRRASNAPSIVDSTASNNAGMSFICPRSRVQPPSRRRSRRLLATSSMRCRRSAPAIGVERPRQHDRELRERVAWRQRMADAPRGFVADGRGADCRVGVGKATCSPWRASG